MRRYPSVGMVAALAPIAALAVSATGAGPHCPGDKAAFDFVNTPYEEFKTLLTVKDADLPVRCTVCRSVMLYELRP